MAPWTLPTEWKPWVAKLAGWLHARNAHRLQPLFVGLLFAQGRRTVASWLRAAELGHDFRAYYYFLGSLGRKTNQVAVSVLQIALSVIVPGDRLLFGLDDTPTKRFGPHVEGAGIHHNPTPGPAGQKFLYGHVWVTLAWLVQHPRWGTIALPLLARLYVRQKDLKGLPSWYGVVFQTKLQLAAALVQWLVLWLEHLGKTLWLVAVGVAGHITAASPGGPRYDPILTAEQRRSADNGDWLCQTCGKLVDNDEARYPIALLREWRLMAEEVALQEIQSSQLGTSSHEEHSIRFGVDDWIVWRERGNLPGDGVVFISGRRRGEVRYSCTIRLRNNLEWEDQLHRFKADFRKGDESLFLDTYVLDDEKPVVLPPRRWVSLEVTHGLRDRSVAETADSVWFVAEAVGDNVRFEWLLAKLAVKVEDLEEG